MQRELPSSPKTSRPIGRTVQRRGATRAVRSRRTRLPGAIALAVAMLSLVFALFYISPLLRVSRVTVIGATAVAADKVAQTADVEGQNIMAVDREEVARAVAQIPMVKSARVTRKLPNEVAITIEERRPWAIWQAQAAKYVIDDEGVVIGTSIPPQGLVTIVDTGSQPVKIGNRVEPGAVEMASKLTQLLPAAVGASPKRFEYAASSGLTVVADKGWQARFGDDEDLEYKVAVLKEILDAAAARKAKVEVVDLRYKGRPYYR